MAELQADNDFLGRVESIIGLLECVTKELMTEDIEEFKLNPSLQVLAVFTPRDLHCATASNNIKPAVCLQSACRPPVVIPHDASALALSPAHSLQ